jgi:hypothetical protein
VAFFLACSSCTGDTLWYLHISLKYILVVFTPSLILPLPLLEQFQQVSFFYFHIWIQNTSTTYTLIPPFLVPTHLPQAPTPRKDLFFPPALLFFKKKIKCILIKQGGLALVFQVCMHYAFIKLPSSLRNYSFSNTVLP